MEINTNKEPSRLEDLLLGSRWALTRKLCRHKPLLGSHNTTGAHQADSNRKLEQLKLRLLVRKVLLKVLGLHTQIINNLKCSKLRNLTIKWDSCLLF